MNTPQVRPRVVAPVDSTAPFTVQTSKPAWLTVNEVLTLLRCSRASLYRWMDSRGFPKPYATGVQHRVWRATEVAEWMEHRA